MNKATLIGIPIDLGTKNLGVDIGPNAFRYEHLIEKLTNVGFKITDNGNISCKDKNTLKIGNPKLKYLEEIIRVSKIIASQVELLIKKQEKIIALGGDHSISLGTISGASTALKGNLGLIYCDAHGDMNTDKTTSTGNIHGMHLASLMGFGDKHLTNIHNSSIKIAKNNLVHIGGNDLDKEEIEFIKKEKIKYYPIFDVLSTGLGPLFKLINNLKSQVKNIWVSLDLDVIDSTYAPGTGMPNKAGLTYREITTIAKYIGENCNVVGLDIVEYNPLQDIDGKTAELGIELIAKLLGSNYSWYTNYLEQNKL